MIPITFNITMSVYKIYIIKLVVYLTFSFNPDILSLLTHILSAIEPLDVSYIMGYLMARK